MARRLRRTEEHSNTCPPAWLWLLAGILIGIFIAFLFYIKQIAPLHTSQPQAPPNPPQQTDLSPTADKQGLNIEDSASASLALPPEAQTRPEVPSPRFEFYDMLPQPQVTPAPERPPAEVELAQIQREDHPLSTLAPPLDMQPEDFPIAGQPYQPGVIQPSPNAAPAPGSVMLQIASFRDPRAANDLQNQLSQKGFTTHIQPAEVKGAHWYRVKLGPYASQAQAQQAQSVLQKQGYKPLIQKY